MILETPKVSILMNCYNGEEFLSEALESILSQTYQNWELIFWDNKSTDKSSEILKSYQDNRIKYHLAPDFTNIGGGRSRACNLLDGEFIACLDVDDIWLPNKLEKQIQLLSDPKAGICISNTYFFGERRRKKLLYKSPPSSGYVTSKLLNNYFVSLESILLKKQFIDE